MAALFRPKLSDYVVNENVEVETQDHEDHTFSGVMFTIRAKDDLPVDFIQVTALSVRGGLGPMTVWVTPDTWEDKIENPTAWTRVYKGNHQANYRTLVSLPFSEPIIIPKGCQVGVYVHSAAHGDESIVYDEQRTRNGISIDDSFIQVGAGLAHLSHVPFSGIHPWGAWRQNRQFVGKISYGAKFQLWNPEIHQEFPIVFKEIVDLFLFMRPQENCPLSWMPNDVLFYILNMCKYDWCLPSKQLSLQLLKDQELTQIRKEEERLAQEDDERRYLLRRGMFPSGLFMNLEEVDDDEEDGGFYGREWADDDEEDGGFYDPDWAGDDEEENEDDVCFSGGGDDDGGGGGGGEGFYGLIGFIDTTNGEEDEDDEEDFDNPGKKSKGNEEAEEEEEEEDDDEDEKEEEEANDGSSLKAGNEEENVSYEAPAAAYRRLEAMKQRNAMKASQKKN